MNRIENTYKRAPLKRHLCAWPIRSCLNEGGEEQTGKIRDRRLKFNSDTQVSWVPMNIFQVFLA